MCIVLQFISRKRCFPFKVIEKSFIFTVKDQLINSIDQIEIPLHYKLVKIILTVQLLEVLYPFESLPPIDLIILLATGSRSLIATQIDRSLFF